MKQQHDACASPAFGQPATMDADYPMCDALDGIPGVSTLRYMHGSWFKNQAPTVIFTASPEIGYLITLLLHRSTKDHELNFNWGLKAIFSLDGQLQFQIALDDPRANAEPFFLLFRLPALRHDLTRLAQLLRTERGLYWCETKLLRLNVTG